MLGWLFFMFAAICNSVMDIVDHHFFESKFNKWFKKQSVKQWWCQEEGWKNKYIDRDFKKGRKQWSILGYSFDKPVQFCDAWHHFKAWMVIFLALALVVDGYVIVKCFVSQEHYTFLKIFWANTYSWWQIVMVFVLELIILGLIWNGVFNLFYNNVLRIKTNKIK